MKVYDKKKTYAHPEDMKKILEYLRSHGDLYIKEKSVEQLYTLFSKYQCHTDWIEVRCDAVLKDFSDWLDNYEL